MFKRLFARTRIKLTNHRVYYLKTSPVSLEAKMNNDDDYITVTVICFMGLDTKNKRILKKDIVYFGEV